jgi:hypothetical protein
LRLRRTEAGTQGRKREEEEEGLVCVLSPLLLVLSPAFFTSAFEYRSTCAREGERSANGREWQGKRMIDMPQIGGIRHRRVLGRLEEFQKTVDEKELP